MQPRRRRESRGRARARRAGRQGREGGSCQKTGMKVMPLFSCCPLPASRGNRVQRRESPLFTFQLLLGEAAGELAADTAAAARGRQIHVLDGYACRRQRRAR